MLGLKLNHVDKAVPCENWDAKPAEWSLFLVKV